MDPRIVAQALAYVDWTVLVTLAAGSFGLVVGLRRATDATTGYLGLTAGMAGVLAALCWLADTSLPPPDGLAIASAPAELDLVRRSALGAFALVGLISAIRLRRGASLRWLGPAGIVLAGVTFVAAAVGWSVDRVDAIPLAVQYVALSAVTGGALAAVVLAHWYLVTPKLGERPLILVSRALAVLIGIQILLFVVWAAFGTGTADAGVPFSVLTGGAALLVWLRLAVSLVGPLVLAFMAERTARSRSMESATGLLYIQLAAVLAGTIVASALVYASGLLL